MPCSFYCKIHKRRIYSKGIDRQSAIRRHYWKHHRPVMLKGVKKRRKKK